MRREAAPGIPWGLTVTDDLAVPCPKCGQANRLGAKFCQECGTPVSHTGPQCGSLLGPTARFCDSCGQLLEPAQAPPPGTRQAPGAGPDPRSYTPAHLAEKILRQRGDLEGERRTVTVLFVDAVDSTPLAEGLGEEDMYSLMQGCMARMMEAVHHYEGHVASFTGDGVMAVFGAPIAHEQSERRAVAAALRMQRSLEEHGGEVRARHGVECRFRVGLHTGPVVVGKVSDELTMEFTATRSCGFVASTRWAMSTGRPAIWPGPWRGTRRASRQPWRRTPRSPRWR